MDDITNGGSSHHMSSGLTPTCYGFSPLALTQTRGWVCIGILSCVAIAYLVRLVIFLRVRHALPWHCRIAKGSYTIQLTLLLGRSLALIPYYYYMATSDDLQNSAPARFWYFFPMPILAVNYFFLLIDQHFMTQLKVRSVRTICPSLSRTSLLWGFTFPILTFIAGTIAVCVALIDGGNEPPTMTTEAIFVIVTVTLWLVMLAWSSWYQRRTDPRLIYDDVNKRDQSINRPLLPGTNNLPAPSLSSAAATRGGGGDDTSATPTRITMMDAIAAETSCASATVRAYQHSMMVRLDATRAVLGGTMALRALYFIIHLAIDRNTTFHDDDAISFFIFLFLNVFPLLFCLATFFHPKAPVCEECMASEAEADHSAAVIALPPSPDVTPIAGITPGVLAARQKTICMRGWSWNRFSILTLFVLSNLAAAGWGIHGVCKSPASHLGVNILISRASARMLVIDSGIVILTSSRWLVSWMRGASIRRASTTDTWLTLHKWSGMAVGLLSASHFICHCITLNVLKGLAPGSDELALITTGNKLMVIYDAEHPWLLLPYWTGIVLLIAVALLSLSGILRHLGKLGSYFNALFGYPHDWGAVVLAVFICVHGARQIVDTPAAPLFIVPCCALWLIAYAIDRLDWAPDVAEVRFKPAANHADHSRARKLLQLDITLRTPTRAMNERWRSSAGHYMLLYAPQLSDGFLPTARLYGWHPFSVCEILDSSPSHVRVRLFMKVNQQGWTGRLASLVDVGEVITEQLHNQACVHPSLPLTIASHPLVVRGPFKSEATCSYSKPNVLLVCAGTGITPMLSIWKHMCRNPQALAGRVVRLMWVSHAQKDDHLLNDIFTTLANDDAFIQGVSEQAKQGLIRASFWSRGGLSGPAAAFANEQDATKPSVESKHPAATATSAAVDSKDKASSSSPSSQSLLHQLLTVRSLPLDGRLNFRTVGARTLIEMRQNFDAPRLSDQSMRVEVFYCGTPEVMPDLKALQAYFNVHQPGLRVIVESVRPEFF